MLVDLTHSAYLAFARWRLLYSFSNLCMVPVTAQHC